MGIHTGDLCFTCNKPFLEDDEVVVCPDCGTPYHRACWKQNGKCINALLHVSGETWKSPVDPGLSNVKILCPNCGTKNPVESKYCIHCGEKIIPAVPDTEEKDNNLSEDSQEDENLSFRERLEKNEKLLNDPCCGISPDETLEDVSIRDLSEFVGSRQLYYLPRFLRFHKTGKKFSFNLPALIFPHLYFAYRKMWLPSILLTALYSILQVPTMLANMQENLPSMMSMYEEQYPDVWEQFPELKTMFENMSAKLDQAEVLLHNLDEISTYLVLCCGIVFCFLGTFLYFRHAKKKIQKIHEANYSESMQMLMLRKEGGTSWWMPILIILGEYLLETMLLFFVILLLLL